MVNNSFCSFQEFIQNKYAKINNQAYYFDSAKCNKSSATVKKHVWYTCLQPIFQCHTVSGTRNISAGEKDIQKDTATMVFLDDNDNIRDVHETFWAETETRPETHVSETETFKIRDMRPRQDIAASEMLAETLKLPRISSLGSELQGLAETFSVMYGETHWQWKKLYGLINLHHGKHFLFVILWVFAHDFDNYYYWIINGLHHKELQLQCCRHEPLCLSQFASNWN